MTWGVQRARTHGFYPTPRSALVGSPMPGPVRFTPRRYVTKIWDFGNFDISPDGRLPPPPANREAHWSIYVRDLRSGREWALVKSDKPMRNPEFSPDGRWIAMQAALDGDENFDLCVGPSRGGEPRNLTGHRMDDASPRWSPDGSKIAFISNRDRDRENVFVMSASGGDANQLTAIDEIVSEIAWRPEGTGIAFSAGVGQLDWIGLVDLQGRVDRVGSFPGAEGHLGGGNGD